MDRSAGCTLRQSRFYRDIASRREYLKSSALSDMYRFFIRAFDLFYAKALCPVPLGFFRECSHANVLVFVCMHDRKHTQRNTLNNGSKDQNLCLLVEYVTVWTNLGTGVGLSVNNRSCLAQRDKRHWFLLTNQCCQNVMTWSRTLRSHWISNETNAESVFKSFR